MILDSTTPWGSHGLRKQHSGSALITAVVLFTAYFPLSGLAVMHVVVLLMFNIVVFFTTYFPLSSLAVIYHSLYNITTLIHNIVFFNSFGINYLVGP